MKYLELSIDRELDFMLKYELTPDELYFIKLIFYAQEDHPEYLSRFLAQTHFTKSPWEMLHDLQEKEIINKSYVIPDRGATFEAKDVEFNKLMLKTLMQHSQDFGMELFNAYPSYTFINGRAFSLRNITKLYHNFDEMSWSYGKAIKFNPETHKEVLEALEWAKDNNQIHSGICDFIESHKWLDIQQLQNDDMGMFNTVELV